VVHGHSRCGAAAHLCAAVWLWLAGGRRARRAARRVRGRRRRARRQAVPARPAKWVQALQAPEAAGTALGRGRSVGRARQSALGVALLRSRAVLSSCMCGPQPRRCEATLQRARIKL